MVDYPADSCAISPTAFLLSLGYALYNAVCAVTPVLVPRPVLMVSVRQKFRALSFQRIKKHVRPGYNTVVNNLRHKHGVQ